MDATELRLSPLLVYGIGLLLGYAPQTVSGDARTMLYAVTVVVGVGLFLGEVQRWRRDGLFE